MSRSRKNGTEKQTTEDTIQPPDESVNTSNQQELPIVEPKKKRARHEQWFEIRVRNRETCRAEIVRVLPTIGQARKWLTDQDLLLTRIGDQPMIVRCRPVLVEEIDEQEEN